MQRLVFTWFGGFVPNFYHFVGVGNTTPLYLMYHCIQYIEIKKIKWGIMQNGASYIKDYNDFKSKMHLVHLK